MCIISVQSKGIPQGATIVKLVTTQAGSGGKPTAIITSNQQSGQTPSNILGLTSVQPQVALLTINLLPIRTLLSQLLIWNLEYLSQ